MVDELKTWAEEQAYERAKAEYMEKLDKIRAEIEHVIDNTYDSTDYDKSLYNRAYKDGLYDALDIIDEYSKEQEDNGFFDEIMDESEDEETYEKIKEIIDKVKEQEE